MSPFAALHIGKSLIDGFHKGLGFVTVNRRSGEAHTARERGRHEITLHARHSSTIDQVTGVNSARRTGSRNHPIGNLLVESLSLGITIPIVGPSHTPRRTGGIIIETSLFVLLHSGTCLGRLMAVPVAPVRDETGRAVLASRQIRVSLGDNARPGTSVNILEKLEVGRSRIARVERIVPLVTRLNLVAINIVRSNPRNHRLGIVQVGTTPLLGSHHESESGIKVGVRSRTALGTITHAPVHTTTITGSIGLPSTIKLVEHRLVIHVHGNQHTIGNTFRNGRTRSFRGKYPASAFVIPSLFPQGIVVLDDLGIRKRNRIAVGALHVLRERERARHNRSRS